MSRFDFIETPLNGLFVIQRKPIEDSRGFFSRFYCAEEFKTVGLNKPIEQINHKFTKQQGAVRGLHFQYPPHAETKIVSCLSGVIFDVAVDLRADSPTFLHWHGEILSAENRKSLLIPEGFAHGFQTLSADCELLYLHTEAYHAEVEGALSVYEPRLNITWQLPITDLSLRDNQHSFIDEHFSGIVL
ncbi:dTDP-4-dehydrorhamnose 3,5-epimerase [Patescibacteria group bacterium]|nr:dTDP-4-dehydrorhamnose 3,5-epimerase [Patescibacteria group bacterium]